jgi:Uma2 family endonuclease
VEELAKTHRFTVEEYHKMGEAGIFSEDDRVELVEGEIVEMTPIGWRHAQAVDRLNGLFNRWIVLKEDDTGGLGNLRVGVQNPLLLHEHGEHQPDLVLYHTEEVRGRLPAASDALLVVEVADTSLPYDRNIKLPLYARAGVAEAWIVDVRAGTVEVHSDPREVGYAAVRRYSKDERVRSATVADLEFLVKDILAAW